MVRLPAVDAERREDRAGRARARRRAWPRAPRLDGLRVLVVDDEPDARNLIAAVLQGRGAGVFLAGSAAEAVTMLQAERPDVVLSDISMRDEDGYDLIRKVRALPAGERGAHAGRRPHRLRPAGGPDEGAGRRASSSTWPSPWTRPSWWRWWRRSGDGHDRALADRRRPRCSSSTTTRTRARCTPHLLSTAGFAVRTAANGEEAIAAADEPPGGDRDGPRHARPERMGGHAAAEDRGAHQDIPVIVLTAHDLDHYRDVAMAAGCDAFLSKPCAIEDLVAAVRRALAR